MEEHDENGMDEDLGFLDEVVGAAGCSVCAQLKREGPADRNYTVMPAVGGGWTMWSAALVRLLRRIGHDPTQAMIISQPGRNDRYVQLLIGHGLAHAEVSSNAYLTGDSRLSEDQEDLLARLGWIQPPAKRAGRRARPTNWTLPLVRGDWQYLVEMFLATIVGVFDFSDLLPVEIRGFLADQPCAKCSWGDELASA